MMISMPSSNPNELISLANDGDIRAFEMLVDEYKGLVYSIAFRLTGDVQESEDLLQETFVRVWKNLSKYNSAFSVKTWIAKITVNLCLDYLKSARHRRGRGAK